jgi:histidinol-phosphate aminotransferase
MIPKILKKVIDFEKMSYVKEDNEVISHCGDIIDCALGTNPYGYSKTIGGETEKIENYEMNQYPAYPYSDLKRDIAKYWADTANFDPNRIIVGVGTMGLLLKINKMFVDEYTTVLGYCPQFTEYITDVRSLGGNYEYILLKPENMLKLDIHELIQALDEKQSLVYVDNPNNPTGQIIPLNDLRLLVAEAEKKGVCVLVDEAYGDFMEKTNSAVNIVDEFDNVFVVKSMSKGFGLAGIRVGYLVCSKVLQDYYRKVDLPFSVTNYGVSITKAALKDYAFVLSSMEKIKASKKRVLEASSKLEFMETDLTVPIMVLRHPDIKVDLHKALMKHNVLTESGDDFIGMGSNAVRMRIPKKVDQLIEVLEKIQ